MAVAEIKTSTEKSSLSFVQKLQNIIDKERRNCTLSSQMQEALIKQIGHELFNKNVYLTFASYYSDNHLYKLETYYKKRADEEAVHAKWIMDYLDKCNVKYQIPKINNVDITINNLEEPFDITVDLEIYTTMCINNLAKLALQEEDFTTFNWLNGQTNAKLILEQQEEETTSRIVAGIAHIQDADWLGKQDAILEYYVNI